MSAFKEAFDETLRGSITKQAVPNQLVDIVESGTFRVMNVALLWPCDLPTSCGRMDEIVSE